MNTQKKENRECTIYPGIFTINASTEKDLHTEIKYYTKAAVGLIDLTTLFKLQISIPAVRREDIRLKVEDNVLFITVKTQSGKIKNAQAGEITEIVQDSKTSYLILPDTADPEFMSAEYRNGILTLHIPKYNCLPISQKRNKDIIVY